jgi:hypothetical protein
MKDQTPPEAAPPAADLQVSFYAGWRAGYEGASPIAAGPDYERGWKAGSTERILDRAGRSPRRP